MRSCRRIWAAPEPTWSVSGRSGRNSRSALHVESNLWHIWECRSKHRAHAAVSEHEASLRSSDQILPLLHALSRQSQLHVFCLGQTAVFLACCRRSWSARA